MAVVLAFNRYTALYKPTKYEMVETRRWTSCKNNPLQLWSNKRQNVCVIYCLLVCLIAIVTGVLAKPYSNWQTRQFASVGNVTIVSLGAYEPLMLVGINAIKRAIYIPQIVFFVSIITVSLVSNIVCVILYTMVFYKYFRLQKTSNDSKAKSLKGEFSLICIGAMIFVANVLFTVYGMLTCVAAFTGGNLST
jgi:hypothetical protein